MSDHRVRDRLARAVGAGHLRTDDATRAAYGVDALGLGGVPDVVVWPANTAVEMQQKAAAYLAAGALEVWLVADDGALQMRDRQGPLEKSALGIEIGPLPR